MDFECFKQAVVGRCAQLGIEEYELYYSCAESTSVGAFQQEINQFTGTVAGGVCFRCIVGGKMGYASTEELSAAEALAVVDRAADNAACLETEDPVFLGQGGQTYQELNLHPYALPTTEELIDKVLQTQKALYEASEKVGGEAVTTGVYPVIFDPKAMSDLLNTFSGIFSSEAAQKGLSRLAGMEGNMVASEVVTIVDDPFHPENPMPIHFDAEGSPTYCKKIVDKGVLNTLLYNLKTAHKAGKMTTGNASKGDYNASVKVRPFTMYIEGGNQTEAELLSMAGNGVYITALEGLHSGANAVSGDFSLQSAGYLIENGKKTKRIKGFTVAGNFYELLKKIVAAADNTCLPRALGMTAFGAPSVLVESLSIAGE